MFTELMLFCMTVAIIVLADYLSCAIGVVLLCILTYLCTLKRLKRFSYFEYKIVFLDTYIQKIVSFLDFLLSSQKWHWFISITRRALFFVARTGENDKSRSNSNLLFTNNFNTAHQCGETNSVDGEITAIVDCILRDYIKSWYYKLSEDEEFVVDIHHVINDTLAAFCSSILKINREEFLCHLLQLYLHFFHHFQEALKKVTENLDFETCLSKKKEIYFNFKMHHWAMKDQVTEWTYFQSLIGTLIDSYGPVELLSCPLLHTVVTEILTQNIMFPLVTVITDSNRLNGWMKNVLLNLHKPENEHLIMQNVVAADSISPTIASLNDLSASVQKPEIVLSQDFLFEQSDEEFNLILHSCDVASADGNVSPDEISDVSIDSLKFETNFIPGSCKNLLSMETVDKIFSPSTFPRMRSNTSTSTKSLVSKAGNVSDNSRFLDVFHLKRSRSADYIQQMPGATALLPLNSAKLSIRYCERTDKHFLQIKPDGIFGDVEMAEEAIEKEMPPLISDIKITNTEERIDAAERPYTLYCIQYIGVFQKMSLESHFPDLVLQVINIKRRFREFLALQSMLEEIPSIKYSLKGIKGPSKWLATPFSNLDKKNVAERRIFLELYLQQLSKQDPIVRTHEFQEFLAYGGDASIAFVKKNSDIPVPRIDKLLARSVKGAIDLFRTAVPNISAEAGVPQEPSLTLAEDSADDSSLFERFPVYLLNYSKKNQDMGKKFEDFMKDFTISPAKKVNDENTVIDDTKSGNKRTSLLHHSHSINNKTGCDCCGTAAIGSVEIGNQFTDICLHFFAESFPNTSFLHILKVLPTTFLQSLLQKKLRELSLEKSVPILHMFHKSMWPETKPFHYEKKPLIKETEVLEIMKSFLEEWSCTNQILKVLMGPLFDSQSVFYTTELLLGSIQNEKLNRCMVFYFLDAIIETTCMKKR